MSGVEGAELVGRQREVRPPPPLRQPLERRADLLLWGGADPVDDLTGRRRHISDCCTLRQCPLTQKEGSEVPSKKKL